MIHFFRRIRQKLLVDGRLSKYLVYALGEIALVMIGILLALQVNNWNQQRINRNSEVKLLVQLKSNLEINETRLIESIQIEQRCASSASIIVSHIDARLPYHDSLNIHFGYAHYSGDVVISTAAYEAIKSKGFDIISNDELRTSIIELFDANYAKMLRETIGLEDLFWPSVALPAYIRHMRKDGAKSFRLKPKDYNSVLSDSEYVSMIELRGSFRENGVWLKKESLDETLQLINQIDQEINP